jgi:predicted NUDIX family NTP pyrophosphohydrolase
MARTSAGLLMYRRTPGGVEVFLVHPGGPFWARKDAGAWSIPKGEYLAGEEDALEAARREFEEETGIVPEGEFVELGTARQGSGKTVTAWAFEGDADPASIRSNAFMLEWPPKSGKQREFPEVDRAEWLTPEAAAEKILRGQAVFLQRLAEILDGDPPAKADADGG